jgi:ubiquinone/menaquinone biosynthesis C-methylase UbiE
VTSPHILTTAYVEMLDTNRRTYLWLSTRPSSAIARPRTINASSSHSSAHQLAEDLVETSALRTDERVLDVACGTGGVTRLAAERVGDAGSVEGLDLNPGMLAVAKSVTPPNLSSEWHEASGEHMPFDDESFDVVLCQMGLQFVPDKSSALREMRRVLAPKGRLALNLPGPMARLFAIMDEALERHIGPEAAGFVRMVFPLDDPKEVEHLLKEAGFREIDVHAERKRPHLPAAEDFLWQYVLGTPLAGPVGQTDDSTRAALEEEVVAQWRAFESDGGMTYEQPMVVATARK